MKTVSYHVAANPPVRHKLLRELKSVMPQPTDHAALQELEKLPYLTAILQEGLRMTHPVTHRLSRALQDKTLTYHGVEIPPGTVVSMTALLLHENEDIFPDPRAFRPERWLGGTQQQLQHYLVPFSRGSRACLGINLAWAEMYLILAHVFRRFDFDVSGVSRDRDIDVAKDAIMGVPSAQSKGIVVKVVYLHD